MKPPNAEQLWQVARWVMKSRRVTRRAVRELSETEENYAIIIKEIDRLEAQRRRAHSMHAAATLTLLDWLNTLDYFDWQCAYCQSRPFQVMSHIIPLPTGGTTPENCVPACYHCRTSSKREHRHIQAYLTSLWWKSEEKAVSL